jgi:putative membrane protein insertion efficiency factor
MTPGEKFQDLTKNFAAAVAASPRNLGRLFVRGYRLTLSPLVGFHCRHLPTCSDYADEALARHGLWAGGWMTLARLLRCQPWGTAGLDFVPEAPPPRARWFLPWRYGRWRGTNTQPPATPLHTSRQRR